MPSSDTPYQAMGASPSKTMDYIKLAGAGAVLFLIGGAVDHLVFGGTKTVLPNDYMPKCSGSETLGVSLVEACERINLAGGGAGARRQLTSVPTEYSCLPHYRLPLTGTDGRVVFPYHAEADLTKARSVPACQHRASAALAMIPSSPSAFFAYHDSLIPIRVCAHPHPRVRISQGDKETTMAIIVIHGANRDADNYFCSFYGLHKDQSYRTEDEVLVITPDFNYESDKGVEAGDAFWNTSRPWGDWRAGAHSAPSSGHGKTVSSYAVLDTFVKFLADKVLFPNLDLISVVGHSAGGQTVQRYALTTSLPPVVRPGLSVRFIVANPSSYGYLDETRPQYKCGECVCNTKECECSEPCTPDGPIHAGALPFVKPDRGFSIAKPGNFVCGNARYNDWPYGLANRWGYTEEDVGFKMNESIALYPLRDVSYLVGQNDTCNDGLAECDGECWQRDNQEDPCFRNHMDNRCPAMLEGPWRKMRGLTYQRFLQKFYGKKIHRFGVVPGAGHNATAIFESDLALTHIFQPEDLEEKDDPSTAAFTEVAKLNRKRQTRYPNIAAILAAEPEDDY